MRRKVIFATVFLFSCGANASGATINVPTGQSTIQAGINAASNGDEVVVDDGTYNELINFNRKAITFRGVNFPG